jgi:hypothetical protein
MSDVQNEAGRAKRPYQAPDLVRIQLRAEEAVLGNCKKASSQGPGKMGCTPVGACRTIGS